MAAKLVHTYALNWEGISPEATVRVEREADEKGNIRFKATAPGLPALNPRYGSRRQEAIESIQRSIWHYYASGNDAKRANREK